ncbi:hypothetical protein [Pseudonocardia endophytica]|uniref:Uncharacterized protein n=1 Tax=Pseudonocardia endophytica TaxID=401976 RepID=A0A4R1HHZ0_PSEEN|nr:hypothetical protein [Pseudonocardia endophytica]TCK21388.1 hypothetical protein EV378_5371 [Pseudonocardia endophytica]
MHSTDLYTDVPPPRRYDLTRLSAHLHFRHPELPSPVVLHWSDEPVLLLDAGRPWLYGPAGRDPAAVDGRAVLPRRQVRRLAQFAGHGIALHALAIAHELDPAGPVAELVPDLADGPRTCTDEVARVVVGPVPAHPALARATRLLEGVVRTTADLLDPIVFGVVGTCKPEHGDLCLFYPLTAWRW